MPSRTRCTQLTQSHLRVESTVTLEFENTFLVGTYAVNAGDGLKVSRSAPTLPLSTVPLVGPPILHDLFGLPQVEICCAARTSKSCPHNLSWRALILQHATHEGLIWQQHPPPLSPLPLPRSLACGLRPNCTTDIFLPTRMLARNQDHGDQAGMEHRLCSVSGRARCQEARRVVRRLQCGARRTRSGSRIQKVEQEPRIHGHRMRCPSRPPRRLCHTLLPTPR